MTHEHLPEGWKRVRLKSVTREIKQRNSDHAFTVADVLGVSNKIGFYPNDREIKDDVSRYKVITHHDFGYNPMRLNVGSLAYRNRPEPGLISPDYVAFRCDTNQLLPEYFNYFRQTSGWSHQIENGGQGSVRIRYYYSDIANFTILLPPVDEQCRITEILHDADANIVHIEAQIGAAQAVKRGVMQRLFTYGLADEETPTKHTRIGEIPAGWEVVQLGQLLHSIEAGRSPQALDRPAEDDEWGVLRVSAVRPEGLQAHENKAVIDPQHINSAYEIHEGDVLISRANTFELVGLVTFVEDTPPRLMLSDKTLRLVVNRNFSDSRFLSYFLQSEPMRQQIIDNATGTSAGMKNISQDSILRLPVACPDLGEQREIAAILSAHDATIRSLQVEAESLREVKRGLMQKLLSGEVRV